MEERIYILWLCSGQLKTTVHSHFLFELTWPVITCFRAVFENVIGRLVWLQRVNIDLSSTHKKRIG